MHRLPPHPSWLMPQKTALKADQRNGVKRWAKIIFESMSTKFCVKEVERVVKIATLSGLGDTGADPSLRGIATAPGISYVEDPFQGRVLHHLRSTALNKDVHTSWEPVMEFLQTGNMDGLVDDPEKMSPREKALLESTILVFIYVLCFGLPDCDTTATRSFSVSTTLLYSHFKPETQRRPTRMSCYFNELLEYSRIIHIYTSDLLPLSASGLSSDQAKSLVQFLSISVHTIIEYGVDSDFMAIENIRILSRFGAQLPISWYTIDLMNAIVVAANRFLLLSSKSIVEAIECSEDEHDEKSEQLKEYYFDGLCGAIMLSSFWIKKSETISNKDLAKRVILLASDSVQHGTTREWVNQDFLLGCFVACKISDETDTLILECVNILVEKYLFKLDRSNRENVIISLARLMSTLPSTSLRNFPQLLPQSLTHNTQHIRGVSAPISLDDLTRIMYSWQFNATSRWDMLEGALNETREKKSWWKRIFGGDNGTKVVAFPKWWEALSFGGSDSGVASIIALYGELGLYQSLVERNLKAESSASAEGVKPPNRLVFLASLVKEYEDGIFDHIDQLASEKFEEDPVLHKQALSFAAALLLSTKTSKELWNYNADYLPLLSILLETLTDDPEVLHIDERFFTTSNPDELARLSVDLSRMHDKNTEHPLHASINRLSRVVGSMAAVLWREGRGEHTLEVVKRISEFCWSLASVWEASALLQTGKDDEYVKKLFHHFKLCLFACTSVFKAISSVLLDEAAVVSVLNESAERNTPEPSPEDAETELSTSTREIAASIAITILRTLSQIHFVTVKFGGGGAGFRAWRDVFDDTIEVLINISVESSIMDLSFVGRSLGEGEDDTQQCLSELAMKVLASDIGSGDAEVVSRLHLRVHPDFIETHILPRAFKPDLDSIDVFESAHDLSLGILERAGNNPHIVKKFAPEYVTILLEAYHSGTGGIDFDLMRRGMTYAVKGRWLRDDEESNDGEEDEESMQEGEGMMSGFVTMESRMHSGREKKSKRGGAFDGLEQYDGLDFLRIPEEDGRDHEIDMRDEGDMLAWECIEKLMNIIAKVCDEIEKHTNTLVLPPQHRVSQPISDSGTNMTDGSTSRLEAILRAANPAVELHIKREQLATVLFDQIRTVGLSNLSNLLNVIRGVMIDGDVALRMRDEVAESDNAVNDSEKDTKHRGWGVMTDPNTSMMWKALFNAVSHARGFDYMRRTGCVNWFMEVRADAVEIWRNEWEKARGRDIGEKANEGERRLQVPVGALTAKL
ncbi:hypothetical protein BC829DRAFT_410130 [Chytridium lagenaria]|nr:hypothetical protein BC829DRAFT_410130 [Chytridium lagenaria]